MDPSPIQPAPVLGIVGGMGPLASGEFVRTLYKLHLTEPEQGSPRCVLDSNPAFPDRTSAIREGRIDLLSEPLARSVRGLLEMGCSRVVIACFTVHCALPCLAEPLRRRVVSLLDLAVDELLARGAGPLLLLATSGTRRARLFEGHPRWGEVAERVRFPDAEDQERLHEWIYRLKSGEPGDGCVAWLASLRQRYGVAGFVFGCTELHLLWNALEVGGDTGVLGQVVDPLWVAARDFHRLVTADGSTDGLTPPAG